MDKRSRISTPIYPLPPSLTPSLPLSLTQALVPCHSLGNLPKRAEDGVEVVVRESEIQIANVHRRFRRSQLIGWSGFAAALIPGTIHERENSNLAENLL